MTSATKKSTSLIEFFHDFSSPYSYIAAHIIEDFAKENGADVIFRPYLMGAVFKSEGTQPLVNYPMKGKYSLHDIPRQAAYHGLDYQHPAKFPVAAIAAKRMFYALVLDQNNGEPAARIFAKNLMRAYFCDGLDISNVEEALKLAASLGHDPDHLQTRIQDSDVKDHLRVVTEEAISRGVFGAPFFLIGDEPFWGVDRLPIMAHYISQQAAA